MRLHHHLLLSFSAGLLLLLVWNYATFGLAPAALTVTSPGADGVVLAELDEYATNVLGDPWDMDEATDLHYYRAESQLTNSQFADGIYSAQLTAGNGGERITLLTAGALDNAAMRIGRTGYAFPINADHYRYLTLRLYKGSGSCASGLVQWYADDTYATHVMGVSNGYSTPCSAGWHTYVLDLGAIGIQQGGRNWNGTIRELILHPYAGSGSANSAVRLDWARLTHENPLQARPFTITWSGDGNGGDVTLYASLNDKSLGGDHDIVIATGQSANGGTFAFQTGVLPEGTYYIAAVNGSGTAWSQGPLVINAPPQTVIMAPSMSSGGDYATAVKGNAWDMNDSNDLNDHTPHQWEFCVSNESFSGGIYQAMNVNCSNTVDYTDSRLIVGHMNPSGATDPVIDTNKYRYLTFRYQLEGLQNVHEGWVIRWGWWQEPGGGLTGQSTVMSRDIIIQEGWNEYAVDLWANDVVDEAHPVQRTWQNSAPNRLRFDPTELHTSLVPARFQIDWIRLTAMEEVARNAMFPIEYTLDAVRPTTLTFYYDTDVNPSNGRSHIGTLTVNSNKTSPAQAPVSLADHELFLPFVGKATVNCPSSCYPWSTVNVPTGEYYICVDSNDGLNATYRCSEAPIRVR